MVKIRFNKFQLPVFFLCVGLFILPSSLRGAISDSPYMKINFIALAALCCIYSNNIKKPACIPAIKTNKWLQKWCVLSIIREQRACTLVIGYQARLGSQVYSPKTPGYPAFFK